MPSAGPSSHTQPRKCDTFPRSVTLFRRGGPAAPDSPTASNWRKSSYSGPGDDNECVEVATTLARIAVSDSKTPARTTLTFPTGAFTPFVEALKPTHSTRSTHSTVTDFARFRG
ncbi:DUF397 domain-containing protein [Streptomyces sp. NPDC058469]|uniref:DUF397 domain-containing protein n=1 Tax=Streptomyces sp. NPDC058469 TaxID=3346514 RepID=UPI00365C2C5A